MIANQINYLEDFQYRVVLTQIIEAYDRDTNSCRS